MLHVAFFLIVIANELQSASVNKKSTGNMEIIRFPDDDIMNESDQKPPKSLSNKFGENEVPEACRHQTYCTIKPADYPEKEFNELFKDYKIPPMPEFDVLGNRQGDIDFETDCDSDITYEPLYQIRSKREQAWRLVVQSPENNFVQRVRLETCTPIGSSCFKPFLPIPDYTTSCEQTYNKWELLVKSLDGNGTEKIKAELPVCCSCKYKHLAFMTRFNTDSSKESNSKETKVKDNKNKNNNTTRV